MKIVLLEGLGVSNQIIEKHARKLESLGHTLIAYEESVDPDLQVVRSRNADVIMLAHTPLSTAVLEKTPSLKFINVAFTGVDHIPVAQAKQQGIAISNASGYATQAVAELCLSFMIQLLRKINQTEARCRNGGTKDGLVGRLLCGKTVGIIGAGAIGRKVAALCKAFGCSVLAYNRSPVCDPMIDELISLEELLIRSDIVSLHCPLTEETKGMIGKNQLLQMKKDAILINTARGGVLDSAALAEALKNGQISGAACDVFEIEPPLPADHSLLHCPNILVTPHIAFSSVESLEQRAEILFQNLYSWLDGKQLNVV